MALETPPGRGQYGGMSAAHPPRRYRGFRPAAQLLSATFREAAERRGFATARLLTHWEEIVGPAIAAKCRPVKIGRSRSGMGATLTLLTTGPHAPLLSMALPAIRDKVNAACGHAAVARVTLTQTASEGFAEGAATFTAAHARPRETPPDHLARAAEAAAGASDPALADALSRLTLSFLAETRKA